MSREALHALIEEAVDHILFERGWIDQTPDEFLALVESELYSDLMRMESLPGRPRVRIMILTCLTQRLGTDYDVNIFRLKHFPVDKHQTFDV